MKQKKNTYSPRDVKRRLLGSFLLLLLLLLLFMVFPLLFMPLLLVLVLLWVAAAVVVELWLIDETFLLIEWSRYLMPTSGILLSVENKY